MPAWLGLFWRRVVLMRTLLDVEALFRPIRLGDVSPVPGRSAFQDEPSWLRSAGQGITRQSARVRFGAHLAAPTDGRLSSSINRTGPQIRKRAQMADNQAAPT